VSVRRLIEEELPLAEINAASAREKSLRHGHISTLHLWWARRPLAMSRAVVYGTLLPDPGDAERAQVLRELADAAEFEASIQPSRMEPLRRRLLEAYGGRAPTVLDCFAGGGTIPLESLRLGCETTALDLNPVAHLIQKGVLEFPQRYGSDASGGNPLAEGFVRWAGWVKDRAEGELADLFPRENGQPRPSVFFWCRTMACPNPSCGVQMPLLSSLRLSDSARRQTWLRLDATTDPIGIELVEGAPPAGVDVTQGTVRASSATCPRCSTAVSAADVRAYGCREGFGERLYAVLDVAGRHRAYRPPNRSELLAVDATATFLERFGELNDGTSELPDEPVDAIAYRELKSLIFGYRPGARCLPTAR
jgi:putative DNA methylase